MKIARATVRRVDAPLTRPYVLSFARLERFVSHVIEIETDTGAWGMGEAVALPGYGSETDEQVAAALIDIAPALRDVTVEDARSLAAMRLRDRPFTHSACATAMDMASGLVVAGPVRWPLLAALATGAPPTMVRVADAYRAEGFRTIKVKIGRDVAADIEGALALLSETAPDLTVRFDANQAYDEDEARRFVDAVSEHRSAQRVELVEQPLPADAWDAFHRLTPHSPLPLMLDESIYDSADVERAAEVGASLVKLKLCKHAGVMELIETARRARELGLGVVLGNGVSTDVGNILEAWAWSSEPDLFTGAGEANGFAKLERPLLAAPPRLERGAMVWAPPQTGHAGRFVDAT